MFASIPEFSLSSRIQVCICTCVSCGCLISISNWTWLTSLCLIPTCLSAPSCCPQVFYSSVQARNSNQLWFFPSSHLVHLTHWQVLLALSMKESHTGLYFLCPMSLPDLENDNKNPDYFIYWCIYWHRKICQHLEKYLAYTRCSITIDWINDQIIGILTAVIVNHPYSQILLHCYIKIQ